jgi:type I restriction enzyme S subunit
VPAVVRDDRKFAFQRHIAHIKPRRDLVHPEFLAAQLASRAVKRQAHAAARGAAQKTVNLADIKAFAVSAPPMENQLEFVSRITATKAALARSDASGVVLTELASSLAAVAFVA